MLTKEEFAQEFGWLATNLTIDEYANGDKCKIRPSDACIQEFAEYTCNDIEKAKSYFNASCGLCGHSVTNKTAIGMSLKYFDNLILCENCFCKKFSLSKSEYQQRVQALKESGCTLV